VPFSGSLSQQATSEGRHPSLQRLRFLFPSAPRRAGLERKDAFCETLSSAMS